MSRVRSRSLSLAGVCLTLVVVGCGGSKPVAVKGIVTLDDKPLARASVLFIAQDPGGRDATGFTDADGAFQLTTFRPKDGAMPGSYKITVHYSEAVAVPAGSSPADVQKATGNAASVVIPARYSQPDQTILKHKVPEDGEVKLELRSRE